MGADLSRKFRATVPGMLLTALLALADAATLAGVTLPDTATVAGRPVRLNGMGLREKYTLDIYVGGLYLTHPTTDAAAALAADEPKRVVMHFVFSVSRDQMVASFRSAFRSEEHTSEL